MAVAPFLAAARPLFRLVQQRVRRLGWLPVLAPDPGVRPDRPHRDLRRPDLRGGDGGQPGPVPHRAELHLVPGGRPVRVAVLGLGGRLARAARPGAAADPRAGRVPRRAAAARPHPRGRARPVAAAHRHHAARLRRPRPHPDEVDPPLRRVRRARFRHGGAHRARHVVGRAALPAQPLALPRRGVRDPRAGVHRARTRGGTPTTGACPGTTSRPRTTTTRPRRCCSASPGSSWSSRRSSTSGASRRNDHRRRGPGSPPGRSAGSSRPSLVRAKRVRGSRSASAVERRARALRIGSAPIAVICGLLVLFEMASMGKAHRQAVGQLLARR